MTDDSQQYSLINGLDYRGVFEFSEIHDDENGFLIIIKDENKVTYRIEWPEWVLSYRKCDESDRLLLVRDLSEQKILQYVFVECRNSEYKKWLTRQKYDIEYEEAKHLIISTSNDIIDVICFELPNISIINGH
jgi:RIO-like serine/threonine protein kinase